jgi:hypothetical protein
MRQNTRVIFAMRDLDRLKCIQGLIDGQLKPHAVATRLGLTTRQVRRLVRQYEQQGPVGLISKLRNRPSNRRLKSTVAEHAFGIPRSTYADFGPTLAAEKLRERHGVDLAVETVRSLMAAGGLWLPRRLRAPKIQQPRSRRACLGELIQIDGCDHRWFEDRAPACTALVYVDDATSRLMVMLFVGAESTFAYFEATHKYLERYGKPLAFYSDKASVFRVNKQSAAAGKATPAEVAANPLGPNLNSSKITIDGKRSGSFCLGLPAEIFFEFLSDKMVRVSVTQYLENDKQDKMGYMMTRVRQ